MKSVYENDELGISKEDFSAPEELSIPIDCADREEDLLKPQKVEENLDELGL